MPKGIAFETHQAVSAALTADLADTVVHELTTTPPLLTTRVVVTRFIFTAQATNTTIHTITIKSTDAGDNDTTILILYAPDGVVDLKDLELKLPPGEDLVININFTGTSITGSYYFEYELRGG